MVVLGAGATYDSVPTRPISPQGEFQFRPPLADSLFEARPLFEKWLRQFPDAMQVAPSLESRGHGESVEDVLARFVGQISEYPHRSTQLAAVRFYIQAIIAATEDGWYREAPVATNHFALLDQIEAARRDRAQPVFVTFNYDRLIEEALSNRGRVFNALDDYVPANASAVVKLHGSVDWVRRFGVTRPQSIGGNVFEVARGICRDIETFPKEAAIEKFTGTVPPVFVRDSLAMPAIAIPVREKMQFECPQSHITRLVADLARVRTVLTVGWRGAESHFLSLLKKHALQNLDVTCVAGSLRDAEVTAANLETCLDGARIQKYGGGFTQFIREGGVERLLNLTWVQH